MVVIRKKKAETRTTETEKKDKWTHMLDIFVRYLANNIEILVGTTNNSFTWNIAIACSTIGL